ncbi:MAG: AAA family ATPase [Actinobacteria bacterium]|nr:AAA family ATPase [Actinomycetota bacterium]
MLWGREAELSQVAAMVEAARAGKSTALLVVGEPGIGKSALCRAAIESASDVAVLTARGIASESELPFAGLTQLLHPILDLLETLPDVQRAALEGALAIGPPSNAEPLAVRVALLGLLAAATDQGPVFCVVDDFQWLDLSSRQALTFVARRLQAERVAMLLATRVEVDLDETEMGIDSVLLEGLAPEHALSLLTERTDSVVAPAVADALSAATGGNPLALVELPSMLTPAQLSGAEPLDDPLPAGPTAERSFHRRIALLDEATRTALLVSAASGSGELGPVLAALDALGIAPSALEPAEVHAIITIDREHVEFRHPLLRSAAYHGVLAPSRRRAHAALADVYEADDDPRAPWHRAAASLGPDESIASALQGVALAARSRGAHATASRALERAAGMTPDPDERARRFGEAAADIHLVGRPNQAAALAATALDHARDPDLIADLELAHASLLLLTGKPLEAYRNLMASADRVEQGQPARASIMEMTAVGAAFLMGKGKLGYATSERAYESAERAGPPMTLFAGAVLGQTLAIKGETDRGRELLQACFPYLMAADPLFGPHLAMAQGVSLSYVWIEEYDSARELLERTVHAARASSAPGLLPFPMSVLSELDYRMGSWDTAYSEGHEALELALETGQVVHAPRFLVGIARIEAQRGDEENCRRHIAESLERAAGYGTSESAEMYADEILGLLEFGKGRMPEALVHLDRLSAAVEAQEVGEPCLMGAAPERIEALSRCGRVGDAAEALERFRTAADHTGSVWGKAAAARCRGLMLDAGSFDEPFTESLRWHAGKPMRFEQARTELSYGERLRRAKRRTEARDMIRCSLDSFERVGSTVWADRARAELAATGEKARKRSDPSTSLDLTPQELRVALAVAEGASNREAAEALFLSAKTVEFHLGNVYRKLGIRSRSELARRFPPAP